MMWCTEQREEVTKPAGITCTISYYKVYCTAIHSYRHSVGSALWLADHMRTYSSVGSLCSLTKRIVTESHQPGIVRNMRVNCMETPPPPPPYGDVSCRFSFVSVTCACHQTVPALSN